MLNSAKELTDERLLGLNLSELRVYPAVQEVYLVKVDIFDSKPYFAIGKVDLYLSSIS